MLRKSSRKQITFKVTGFFVDFFHILFGKCRFKLRLSVCASKPRGLVTTLLFCRCPSFHRRVDRGWIYELGLFCSNSLTLQPVLCCQLVLGRVLCSLKRGAKVCQRFEETWETTDEVYVATQEDVFVRNSCTVRQTQRGDVLIRSQREEQAQVYGAVLHWTERRLL